MKFTQPRDSQRRSSRDPTGCKTALTRVPTPRAKQTTISLNVISHSSSQKSPNKLLSPRVKKPSGERVGALEGGKQYPMQKILENLIVKPKTKKIVKTSRRTE